MLDIEVTASDPIADGLVPAASQVVRLVAIHVDHIRRKERNVFLQHPFEKAARFRVPRVDRQPAHPRRPVLIVPGCFAGNLREVAVLRQAQYAAHMAKRGERWNQRDEPRPAIPIDRFDVAGCQRRTILADGGIELKIERVFHVELKVVDLQSGQSVHQLEQRLDLRHTPTRHVVGQPTDRQVGGVLDAATGPAVAFDLGDLPQRSHAVKQPGHPGGDDPDAGSLDQQTIRLGSRHTVVDLKPNVRAVVGIGRVDHSHSPRPALGNRVSVVRETARQISTQEHAKRLAGRERSVER